MNNIAFKSCSKFIWTTYAIILTPFDCTITNFYKKSLVLEYGSL